MADIDPNLPAYEAVYRQLRQSIMHGVLEPGQAITIRGLAEEFGVSMTPAREAARRLCAEGALTLSNTGRVSAPQLSPERISELATLRAILEVELAGRAIPRAHLALIDRLTNVNALMDQAMVKGEAETYIRQNLEFHRSLYLRAQAPATLALVETVWLQLGPTMRARFRPMRGREATQYHRSIIAALKAGDEPTLKLAIRADVTQGLAKLARPV